MHYLSETIISGTNTTSQTSSTIPSEQLVNASFHAVFGDTTAGGTLTIQGSNDPISTIGQPAYIPTDWADIPNATATIVAGASSLIVIPNLTVRWCRAVYTSTTPGTSTIIVNVFAQYP